MRLPERALPAIHRRPSGHRLRPASKPITRARRYRPLSPFQSTRAKSEGSAATPGSPPRWRPEPSGPAACLGARLAAKQRPKRGKHSRQTLCTSSSDVYPCPKIFPRRASSKTRPARAPLAGRLGHRFRPASTPITRARPYRPLSSFQPTRQKARGPLRPQILYRGRDQSRADPRPAGVRISMPKQRPRRGKRLW